VIWGPGTEFFGTREHAGSFAYVIDCSGSMATRNSLEVAKRELLTSLNQLPPDAQFGVIFYNLQAFDPLEPRGKPSLLAATAANKNLVQSRLGSIVPDGGTDHMLALRKAIELHTEVIFFLTDGDLMTRNDVTEILGQCGTTRIQCIEFGRGIDIGGAGALRRLAGATGGTYRYIDVTRFPGQNR
jgi:Mg-chelatase subunit ChlD